MLKKLIKFVPLLLLFFGLTPLLGQNEQSKTIEKEYALGKDGVLKVDHRYGLLKVIQSKDGKVHLNARLRVEGSDEESVKKALDQFELDISELGNQVTVDTDLHIKNWNSRNGRTTLTFDDGSKVKGLKKFKAEMLLSVPNLKKMTLKNKYEDIIIDHDFNGDLEVVLHDGDLQAENLNGNLELNIKYGHAQLKTLKDGDLTLYDSKMECDNAETVKMSSKYSEYTIGDTKELTIKAYDDKMELGNVKGRLDITDKYSEIKVGNFGEATLDIYDAAIAGKKGKQLRIDESKYSKFRFTEIGTLNIDKTFDDEFIVRNVENLEVKESKYTEFEVESLTGKIGLLSSYDDKLTVNSINKTFKGLIVDGKYTKVNLAIPESVKYELDVEMTHGSIEYPEATFENKYYKEKDSNLSVKGKSIGAGENAPKVLVKGYDCKIVLK